MTITLGGIKLMNIIYTLYNSTSCAPLGLIRYHITSYHITPHHISPQRYHFMHVIRLTSSSSVSHVMKHQDMSLHHSFSHQITLHEITRDSLHHHGDNDHFQLSHDISSFLHRIEHTSYRVQALTSAECSFVIIISRGRETKREEKSEETSGESSVSDRYQRLNSRANNGVQKYEGIDGRRYSKRKDNGTETWCEENREKSV